jgi:hypothetical protein
MYLTSSDIVQSNSAVGRRPQKMQCSVKLSTHVNVLDMTTVHRPKCLRELVAFIHKCILATPKNTAILIEICSTDSEKFKQHWDIFKLFSHNRRRHMCICKRGLTGI